MAITDQELRRAIRCLGLSGQSLCLHSSLRSFGWIEGGASTVTQGFLAEACTVLVPTFSWDTFSVSAPVGMRPERNGWNYDKPRPPLPGVKRIYTPETQEIDEDMGAIPLSVVTHPQHIRGNHPLCSFTAVGSHAQELVAGQRPLHVFAPLEVLATIQGWVLLMGVGLESMTLIHLAEQRAGRHLFRRWANGPDGGPMEVEVGGCSNGFEQLTPLLTSLEKRIQVGQSLWRAFSVQDTLEIVQKNILKNPSITHCSIEECGRCRDAIAGGPLSTTSSLDNG
jgi:aminoglycoside 3-N-acetyltransferase